MTAVPSASAIMTILKDKAVTIVGSAAGAAPVEAFAQTGLGGLPYNWQYTADVTKFNKPTYTWISSNIAAGTGLPPLALDANSFVDLYFKAISAISFSLSIADQATLGQAANNATMQSAALQNAWIAAFGALPGGKGTPLAQITGVIASEWASPSTTLTAIKSSPNLNTLLNLMPPEGGAVVPALVNWLNAMSSVLSLQNSVSLNTYLIGQAVAAVQTLSVGPNGNGGMTLSDNTVVPLYTVTPENSAIQNAMASTASSVNMAMTVTQTTDSEYTLHIEGQADLTVSADDFVSININGNADYFKSDIATTENSTSVSMSFPGINLVTISPSVFQTIGTTTGWYWIDAIRQAIANGSTDVTGYKFAPNPEIDFSTSGPFGYVMGAIISSYPTITITTISNNYTRIQSTFSQTVAASISVFGMTIASGSESSYSNNVTVDASNQSVTITLAPPPQAIAGTVNAAQGWVLGVQPCYPAA